MRINLIRQNSAVHFEAVNEDGAKINIDGSPDIGGENKGLRPMQLLLAGIGGCSAIDIVSILKKQRQNLEDLQIDIDGTREEGAVPSLFKSIHVHFKLKGELDDGKVKKAVDLSMTKYCSVAKTLEKTAKITFDYEIN